MNNNRMAINPLILKWARKRLNYDKKNLIEKFPKYEKWESGEDLPSYKQLKNLSKDLDLTTAVFFFPEPPKIEEVKTSFRASLLEDSYEKIPPQILKLINKAKVFQYNIAELYDFSSEQPSNFLSDFSLNENNIKTIIVQLRERFKVNLQEQFSWKKPAEALKVWRKKIEDLGVFVFRDAFKNKDFSGFCLYDEKYPIIYINSSNPPNRQIFTLFHELAHLLLGVSGIDKTTIRENFIFNKKTIEVLCNQFAGNFLVPYEELKQALNNEIGLRQEIIDDSQIKNLAEKFSVSRDVIVRKLFDYEFIEKEVYEEKAKKLEDDFKKEQESSGSTGGNFYKSKKSYLSLKYAQLGFTNFYNRKISEHQLYDYFAFKKTGNLDKLEKEYILQNEL